MKESTKCPLKEPAVVIDAWSQEENRKKGKSFSEPPRLEVKVGKQPRKRRHASRTGPVRTFTGHVHLARGVILNLTSSHRRSKGSMDIRENCYERQEGSSEKLIDMVTRSNVLSSLEDECESQGLTSVAQAESA